MTTPTGATAADSAGTAAETPEETAENTLNTPENPDTTGDEAADEADEEPGDAADAGEEAPEKSDRGATDAGTGSSSGPARREREPEPLPPPLAPGQTKRAYDWPAIRARYVEGLLDRDQGITIWPSLDECAGHYGVVAARVREKSAAEGWVEQRARYQQRTEATRQHARAAALSKKATELDGKALDSAKLGLQLCFARLSEIGQAAQRRRTEAATGGSVGDVGRIDAQEQTRLAQAVDLWHKVGLRAVGDPETTRVEITGAGGQPIEIAAELRRDDPNRITGVLAVLAQAGLGDLFGGDGADVAYAAVDGVAGDDGRRAALEAGR